MTDCELDVRSLRKPDKHPAIFGAYAELSVGQALVLINDHDPRHLHDEFDVEHPGSYSWNYLDRTPRAWRIRITKLASTPLPRVVASTAGDSNSAGWNLDSRERDLDCGIVALAPDESLSSRISPQTDMVMHVLSGSGRLATELDGFDLSFGDVVWLPRMSRREVTAGHGGLRYLIVHRRRQSVLVSAASPGD